MCSDSSLSPPLLITPSDISSPSLQFFLFFTLLLLSCLTLTLHFSSSSLLTRFFLSLHFPSSLMFPSPAPVICTLLSSSFSPLHPQVQYSAYVGIGGLFSVAKFFCGGLFFWFLVKFSLGRKLLTTVGGLLIS